MSLPTRAQFSRQIQSMDASKFERFVADIWRARGWTARVTQDGSDRGVDVVATKTKPYHQKEVIQAKRYSDDNPVGSPQIQQYASLRQQENADTVVVVTSGRFSEQAEELARQLNVKLIDGNSLYNLIESEGLDAVISEYLVTDNSGAEPNSTVSVSTAPQSSETPASTKTDQQGRRTVIVLITIGIIGIVALVGLSGVLIALSIPDSPEAGGAVGGSPTPTRTPVPTAQSSSTETPTPTVTPSTTPTPTPIESVSDGCPTLPESELAENLRPTTLPSGWREVSAESGVQPSDTDAESFYIAKYETANSHSAVLTIEHYSSKELAKDRASGFQQNNGHHVQLVLDEYFFRAFLFENEGSDFRVLNSSDATESAKMILSRVGGASSKFDVLGAECVDDESVIV